MRKSIALFKYKNKRKLADFYAKEIYRRWSSEFDRLGIDVLVPVPISKQKRKERGYNQAELISKRLGELMKVEVDKDCLIRKHNTTPQKSLDNVERYNNLKNAFGIKDISKNINNILIIDDIYTTGATIDTCARLFKEHGFDNIYYASVCIGKGY